ncbi:MAG: phosphoglucomutase/phosphomannomutase family protein [Firmicutes bacterium]|nr:phosphoglucomutase/phosphomannomutase family protein [Bacillota bacterium]MDD4264530.1 phosphoglucomutase/phosphomannomutase family protein [Bacillota bacterium]MDD4693795.1 phosphoglucomutase/phosphomannomutase family protein [Bacillota bacterium]
MQIRFGTDGWRAILCEEFTLPNSRRVAKGIARYVLKKTENPLILVAYDGRFMNERFAREAALVLQNEGARVLMTEKDTATPVIAFAVKEHRADGALMFTASHNPPEYNGIKFIPDYAGPASLDITEAIEKEIAQIGDVAVPEGNVETFNPDREYEEHLKTLVNFDRIRSLKIAYDAMHGAGRTYIGRILRDNGVEVFEFNTNRDPLFGGRPPEPISANMSELVESVKNGNVDLGLATDGDADRFGVIDTGGRYITANEVLVLIYNYLIETKGPKSVARTVATTHLLDAIAKAHNVKSIETPVGFKHIGQVMREQDVVLGGEESGGLSITGHIPEKDGILADLLIAELRAYYNKPLVDVLDEIFFKYGKYVNKRLDLRLSNEKKVATMNWLKETEHTKVGPWKVEKVNKTDGVKIILRPDLWILARASGTEPLVRVYLEASSDKELLQLEKEAKTYLGL